jgi:hypothetical protein
MMKSQAEIAQLPFWDVPIQLSASKRRSYRESHFLIAESIAAVFTEQGLAKFDWAAKFKAQPETFRVLIGDLTEEGFAFGVTGFQEWLKQIEHSTAPRSLEELSTSLRAAIQQSRMAKEV